MGTGRETVALTGLSLAQIDGGLRRNNLLWTDFADEISILIDEVAAKGSPGLRIDAQPCSFSLPNVSFPKMNFHLLVQNI